MDESSEGEGGSSSDEGSASGGNSKEEESEIEEVSNEGDASDYVPSD